jgi:hypothetical protein
VDLVEHQVAERSREHMPVGLPHQEEVQLLVVSEEDVGRVAANLRSRQALRIRGLLAQCQGRSIAVPGVQCERDLQSASAQQPSHALQLIVRQGVHRVDEDGLQTPDALGFAAEDPVQDGEQERLGLARAGPRGDDKRAPFPPDSKRLLLMLIQAAFAKGPVGL